MTLSILAIDPSTSCTGWAFGEPGQVPVTGSLRFAPLGASDETVFGNAIVWMTKKLNEFHPDHVAIEAPFLGGKTGTNSRTLFVLFALNMFLRTTCKLKTGREAIVIYPVTARKVLTGKAKYDAGQAKPAVFAKCLDLNWIDVEDPYDVSDACAVWAAAAVKLDPSFAANFTPLGQAVGALV